MAAAAEKESLEQSSHGRSRSMLASGLAPLLARVVSGDFTELRDPGGVFTGTYPGGSGV